MDVLIRPAVLADAPAIAEFNARIAEETEHRHLDLDTLSAGVRAVVSDASKGIYFVAETDRRVVGQLMITYEWSDWRNGNFWWIQSVYVDKAFRGRGVFKRLFAHVCNLAAKEHDVCGLRLYVDQENASAMKTYETLGMMKTSYEMYEMDFVHGA
ncbi:MAG: GNAT family N-acetyltransferase [Ignavibacteriales bacterium]|nr:GNAT family N-acetyltransferase [Ignavibacteriales bacterium]